jgi:phospholipid/cholesterol/gamma-HCH transport system permease protein
MSLPSVEVEKRDESHAVFRFRGRIERDRVNSLWTTAIKVIQTRGLQQIMVDFKEVSEIDSAGIALLRSLENLCADKGITFSKENIPEGIGQFLNYTRSRSTRHGDESPAALPGSVSRLGTWSLQRVEEAVALVRFVGDFVYAMAALIAHPRQIRVRETLYHLQAVGAEAMLLVFGLSFLMGIIMAFQSATTLTNFGAAIYVADIVTISTTREMGPLLTAVIIAGRSGAAFAAEIGTMKINEEIDALEVMGFDITRFLVLPRVMALMVAGPLLTLLANAAGILGGASVGLVVLKVSMVNYFSEVNKILTGADMYTGLIKGFVFASLIGLVGCFRGLRTGLAAENVGIQATSAVVSGILLLIIADALLTAVFQTYGW